MVPALLTLLADRAGRVIWNGWPTGVAVTGAMHHGGPYPATTAPLHTSVGTAAIGRFLRPVCYQSLPDPLLPPALRRDNPLGIPRTGRTVGSVRGSDAVEIVRYRRPGRRGRPRSACAGTDGRVTPAGRGPTWPTCGRQPAADLPDILAATSGRRGGPADEVVLLPPVDGRTEVWAAGVTYARSRSAREEESTVAGLYALVYEAERPELFFKSVAWRVVTDGEPVAIREDSELNVPEAELAVVANAGGEIVGYGVCNDMSSRSIEGENPLYLPQAKIYAGSCALAPGHPSRLGGGRPRPSGHRGHRDAGRPTTAWQGRTQHGGHVHRTPERPGGAGSSPEQSFPAGVILSTGTGLVARDGLQPAPR